MSFMKRKIINQILQLQCQCVRWCNHLFAPNFSVFRHNKCVCFKYSQFMTRGKKYHSFHKSNNLIVLCLKKVEFFFVPGSKGNFIIIISIFSQHPFLKSKYSNVNCVSFMDDVVVKIFFHLHLNILKTSLKKTTTAICKRR